MSFFFAGSTATDYSSINCIFYNNNNPTKQGINVSFCNRGNQHALHYILLALLH